MRSRWRWRSLSQRSADRTGYEIIGEFGFENTGLLVVNNLCDAQTVNVPIERLLRTSTATPTKFISPLQSGVRRRVRRRVFLCFQAICAKMVKSFSISGALL
jgi:hypothetical protein